MSIIDINECERPQDHGCFGECINTIGGYKCQCPRGTHGNYTVSDGCIKSSTTGYYVSSSFNFIGTTYWYISTPYALP